MNKTDFITKVKENVNLEVTKKDLTEIFDSMINVIIDSVKNDEEITLPGICKIKSKMVEAKSGVTKLGGVETPWSKPKHKEGAIKALPSFKKIFE